MRYQKNVPARRRALDDEQRAAFRDLILGAMRRKGWSHERIARAAVARLRALADDDGVEASAAERQLWREVSVSRHAVARLPDLGAPFLDAGRRARVLGVALALDVDLAKLNRCGGGL